MASAPVQRSVLRDNQMMQSAKKTPPIPGAAASASGNLNSNYELRSDLTLAFDTLLQPFAVLLLVRQVHRPGVVDDLLIDQNRRPRS